MEANWKKLNPAESHKKSFKYDITRALCEMGLTRAQLTPVLKLFRGQCTSDDEYLHQMAGHINRGTVPQVKFIKKCMLARATLLGLDVRANLPRPDGGTSAGASAAAADDGGTSAGASAAAAASSGDVCDPPDDSDGDDDNDTEVDSWDDKDASRGEDEEADASVAPAKRKLKSGTRGERRKRSRRYGNTGFGLDQVLCVLCVQCACYICVVYVSYACIACVMHVYEMCHVCGICVFGCVM